MSSNYVDGHASLIEYGAKREAFRLQDAAEKCRRTLGYFATCEQADLMETCKDICAQAGFVADPPDWFPVDAWERSRR